MDRPTIKRLYDIAVFHASLTCRAIRQNLVDKHTFALRQSVVLCHVIRYILNLNTEPSVNNLLSFDQRIKNALCLVNWNRKPDSFKTSGAGKDGYVYTYYLALQIHKRPTAVSRI